MRALWASLWCFSIRSVLLVVPLTAANQQLVTWQDPKPTVHLIRGEEVARVLILTSSVDLGEVSVSASPAIAGLIRFDAGSKLIMKAGVPSAVHLTFLASQDLPQGTYIGRLQLRKDKIAIGQPLRVVVEVQPKLLDFAVGVNKTDPLLFRITSPTGRAVEFFGDKDDEGQATSLTGYNVTTPGGSNATFELDPEGRPRRISVPDGFVFTLTWISNSRVLVSGVTADGKVQVNAAVELPEQPSPKKSDALKTSATTASCSPAIMNLTHCGQPEDEAVAYFEVTRSTSIFGSTSTPAPRIGSGTYRACIATADPDAGNGFRDKCESFVGVLDNTCLGVQVFTAACPALTLASSVLGPEAVLIMLRACVAAESYAATACAVISPIDGADSPWSTVCGDVANAYNSFINQPITLRPVATVPGSGKVVGSPAAKPAQGPFGTFSLQVPGKIAILSFTTSPIDPAPFQGYTATAEVGCAPPNTSVELSIFGTDGYHDSTVCTISGTASCALFVPGAEAGVVDTLTVEAEGLSRTISIVF